MTAESGQRSKVKREPGRCKRGHGLLSSPLRVRQIFREHEWLFIVCTVVFLMASGLGIVTPILPIYARTYEISTALVGLLLTVFGLGRILVGIPAGHAGDRLGPKRLLVLGPFVMAMASAGVAGANTYQLLLIFRFLQGVGSAIQMTGGYLAVAALSPRGEIAKSIGIYQSSLLLGMSVGPWVGGLAATTYGFRSPFVAQAVLAALAALWSWKRFPHITPKVDRNVLTPDESFRRRLSALFRKRDFLLISLVAFFVFLARGGTKQTVLPLFGHDRLGLSVAMVGTAYAIITLFELIALSVAGGLSDRFGRKRMIVSSLITAGLSFVWIGFTASPVAFLVAGAFLGFTTGIGGPSPAAYVSDIVSPDAYGVSFGVFRAFADVGLVLGPLLAGMIADAWDLSVPFYATGSALLLMGVVFGLLASEGDPEGHRSGAGDAREKLDSDRVM